MKTYAIFFAIQAVLILCLLAFYLAPLYHAVHTIKGTTP